MLEEFQCTATKAGACVVLGGCLEVGAEGLPYAPFATILRRLHRELGRELELAAEGRESSLARLLPDFGEAVPEANDEFARARLFEHTARLFEKLTADRTLVLAIEDLHWSDRSTRELLAYLIRTLQQSRLVLVATYRSDDLHRRHPVRPYLAELERLRTVQRLELPRLDRLQVASQLAGILAPDEPSPELVGRIWRRSEGNPFFVEELAVSVRQGCGTGLTDSLRDLLLVRVEGLPERTQTLLRVLAEGGSTVEHELLAGVLDWPEEELTESLRSAVGANIIGPSADGDGYRFRHALVREAVSDDLMPGSRSGSTAATPRRWTPGPGWSPPTSGPLGWPGTGTAPTTPRAHCPPCWRRVARRAGATPSPSSSRCWSGPWSCGTTPRPRCWRTSAPTTGPTTATPSATARSPTPATANATAAPCSWWTCWPRPRSPPGSAGRPTAACASPRRRCGWSTRPPTRSGRPGSCWPVPVLCAGSPTTRARPISTGPWSCCTAGTVRRCWPSCSAAGPSTPCCPGPSVGSGRWCSGRSRWPAPPARAGSSCTRS
ncbi:ATP-binding protein [Streptacidiphilus monticola]